MSLSQASSLLVIKPSALGDVVQTVGVVRALKATYPQLSISWLVNAEYQSLLEPLSFLDRVYPFERKAFKGLLRSFSSIGKLTSLIKELRKARFDAVIDFQGLFRSAWLSKRSGAPLRVGFSDAREMAPLFYTHKHLVDPATLHSTARMIELADFLGTHLPRPLDTSLESNDDEKQRARELARSPVAPIVLCPGAQWRSKMWPSEYWADFADRLSQHSDAPILLVASKDDSPTTRAICERATTALVDLAGKTSLRELAALFSISRLVVSNDSGPMHMAAAQGAQLIALFGPTNPERTGPWGEGHTILRPDDAPKDHRAYRRIVDDSVMRKISVESVLEAAHNRLGTTVPQSD